MEPESHKLQPSQDSLSSLDFNKQVSQIFENQKEIDGLVKTSQQLSGRLTKNNKKWIEQYDQLLSQLTETGDLVNWASVIETELAAVNDAI